MQKQLPAALTKDNAKQRAPWNGRNGYISGISLRY
jgi:hypothetical protein